jgi:nucleoid DNA-binding protein
MNLTDIIVETGRRVRRGKMPADKLSNAEVKAVLEAALAVMSEALLTEGRIEIQGFAVIERKITAVKASVFRGKVRKTERVRWIFRPSRVLQTDDKTA